MQKKNAKDEIAEVFSDLLKRKNINKITVKDIADGCGITRQGFYYHFRDILALIEWIMQDSFEKSLRKNPETAEPVKMMEEIIYASIKNKDIMGKFLKYKDREAIERIMIKILRDFVKIHIDEITEASSETEVIVDFYSFGIAGAVLSFCERENADVKESAKLLIEIINKGIVFHSQADSQYEK